MKIVEAGHGDKLAPTIWAAGEDLGIPVPIPMVLPLHDGKRCAFLNDRNLCDLHDSGLKPTEGKLSTHWPVSAEHHAAGHVAKTWLQPRNWPTVLKILELLK